MTKGAVTRRDPDAVDRRAWPLIGDHDGYTSGEVQRFLGKVNRGDPGECWWWTSAVSGTRPGRAGYGALTRDGGYSGRVYAHRMSYELAFGKLPAGYEAAHRCNHSKCVNPSHLYAATRRQNAIDACRDGLMNPPRGEECYLAKLTNGDVERIRRDIGVATTPNELAAELGVSPAAVTAAASGRSWSHLPGGIAERRRWESERKDIETLAFIRAYWASFGRSPTLRQIAAAMGLADASSALRRVRRLESTGRITRDPSSGGSGARDIANRPIRLSLEVAS